MKFLNSSNKSREGQYGNIGAVYSVPSDFNRTPSKSMVRWDQRIVDEDVARLMRMVYSPIPGSDFASSGCVTVDAHYSPPYCKIAKEEFGFGNYNATTSLG